MEKQIIIVKPKTLSPKDKEKLTKAGNVVVEHPSPLDIIYKPHAEMMEYDFINCVICGERIYLPKERILALRGTGKALFYCSQGHTQSFRH